MPQDHPQTHKNPRHRALYLIVGLAHRRRLKLRAFTALLRDPGRTVAWVAAQLAVDSPGITRRSSKRVASAMIGPTERHESSTRALNRLGRKSGEPLTAIPPAWVKSPRNVLGLTEYKIGWIDPDPCFYARFAANIFPHFPVEAWCCAAVLRRLARSEGDARVSRRLRYCQCAFRPGPDGGNPWMQADADS